MTMPTAVSCPHCAKANVVGARFCESCGMALPVLGNSGPRVVGDQEFASTASGVALQQEELVKQMKKATGALLAVAIVQTLFVAIVYFINQGAIQQGRANGPVLLGTVAGIAVLFWALYIWAKKNPFPAALVGLVVYVTLWILDFCVAMIQQAHSQNAGAVASPFNGIILKIIIVAILYNGVKAGTKYRQLKQQGSES